jgi:hypothetical protein
VVNNDVVEHLLRHGCVQLGGDVVEVATQAAGPQPDGDRATVQPGGGAGRSPRRGGIRRR